MNACPHATEATSQPDVCPYKTDPASAQTWKTLAQTTSSDSQSFANAIPASSACPRSVGCSSLPSSNTTPLISTDAALPLSYVDGSTAASTSSAYSNGLDATDTQSITTQNSLPTARQVSSIPRATEDSKHEFWVYPSQQQFYNAMKRKNYDPQEDDMSIVVPLHNIVNEMAWMKILEWEKRYCE
jgi:cytochrome c heme-lyase